tara:strand:+ start:6434 stop:7366 length:933 start_codon:yes stop_codon:yes gene_type:complete
MPKSKKSRVEFSFEEELVADIVTEEVNPNFIYASPGVEEEEEAAPAGPEQLSRVVLDVIEKEEIVETDIFDLVNNMSSKGASVMIEDEPAKKPPIVRKVKDNDEPLEALQGDQPNQKLTKKGKTRKPMSDAHKAKLVLAREKANAVRKKNALLRKEQRDLDKDNKDLAKELKRKEAGILKKQRLEAVRALDGPLPREEKAQPSKPSDFEEEREYKNNKLDEQYLQQQQPVREPAPPSSGPRGNLTRKDLEDAQFDAIMKYESLRKERKAEKKQKEMIERQQADLKQKINNFGYGSKAPNGRLVNRWDSCY